ncbi:TPA: DUF551 domain-containing protein [Escherichia coli]|nr:DUF551 domain-containing protein [Escherichia coli]MCA7654004.1 DUF551 domain-containing protein [Escherichia coli]MDZ9256706.1 DUF551 domain-containing protein [Escherichia coli]HBB0680082.1 DUF551 domain-containing protein [Escherichia coli]
MTTVTDKELIKEIKERIGSLDVRDNIERRAYEIALASLEADPVAYIFKHPAGKLFWALTDESNKEQADVIPVYAASPAPIASEAIENAIEYIRSIVFHIDEDDYHGKHIAYFMRQALAWLEGHSCSDDRLGKADNQPASGNQAAESNRGNEWTGNPDIDNAIIMLDRIDTTESYDDDRIEAVKAVLRRLAGNSPVTPDGWISCSERMPAQDDWILIYSKHGEYMAGQVQGEYVELSDGTLSWLGNALYWMPLPEPPQEVNRG